MTTTEEPEPESSSGEGEDETVGETSGSSSETTEVVPPLCGDGNVDPDEECDNAGANADDAACTSTCKNAVCGDGKQQVGKEVCDDGTNDGSYDGCLADCSALGPYCGDGIIDAGQEACDSDDPESGCLKTTCQYAKSCLDLKQAWDVFALTGVYSIYPDKVAVLAYCDMDTDNGGYTFVKFGAGEAVGAAQAEKMCADIGMQLLVPRTAAHLAATAAAAADTELEPQEGMPASKASSYLKIFGIYPKTQGMSCVGAAFNQGACPEWKASDDQAFWISGAPLAANEPGTDNCAGCSMVYSWNGDALAGYETIFANGFGADSTHFMCDVGDKLGMN